uniref:Uncharacterized protein n=1 Tax=Glossina palpalis gambiensis TaxID=67801 RepID=A0A1B0BQA5_9MUSC
MKFETRDAGNDSNSTAAENLRTTNLLTQAIHNKRKQTLCNIRTSARHRNAIRTKFQPIEATRGEQVSIATRICIWHTYSPYLGEASSLEDECAILFEMDMDIVSPSSISLSSGLLAAVFNGVLPLTELMLEDLR